MNDDLSNFDDNLIDNEEREKILSNFVDKCFYNLMKTRSKEVINAFNYLTTERKISKETIDEFSLGYCQPKQELCDYIKNYGGEYLKGHERDLSYFIQGRIIVPIYDEMGESIIGMATRPPFSGKEYTWWNLPYPFQKSYHLYMLHKSRPHIFKHNKVYLVEGYADALSLWQSGIKNVACIMGTSLSLRQVGLIIRYCNEICFCFDVDENNSGQRAFNKSVYLINQLNVFNKISKLNLPLNYDPDDFVKKYGKEKLLSLEQNLSDKDIDEICNVAKSSKNIRKFNRK